jgi:hypothetical protein
LTTYDTAPAPATVPERTDWLERLAPIGGLVFAVWLLIGFFTSGDYDDTPADLVAHAERDETNLLVMLLLALATPLLIGSFVAGLMARMRSAESSLRALTLIGGTLFAALLTVGLILWSAPLLDDDLNETSAAAYLALDDAGWVLLGAAGVGIALMIVAVSLAALRYGWVPKWAGWVSLLLGVVSFFTVAGVGFFAWIAWLIAAGLYLLLRGDRREVATTP